MESQSISHDGYFRNMKLSVSSHGISVKSKCCISNADADDDPDEESSPSDELSDLLSSEPWQTKSPLAAASSTIVGAGLPLPIVAGSGLGWRVELRGGPPPLFEELAKFWQRAWSLASTVE